jgi:prevent-host-death family protein
MLYKAMPTVPVSDLRNRQAEIIAELDHTPVMLTNRGEGTGVLVNPTVWNNLLDEIERLRQIVRLQQISKRMADGDYLTKEQVEAELKERGLL